MRLPGPGLVLGRTDTELSALRRAYRRLDVLTGRPKLLVAGYFGGFGPALPILLDTPIDGLALDLVAGRSDLDVLAPHGSARLVSHRAAGPPYQQRVAAQAGRLPLPPLPTTTIGSFPQTDLLRAARAQLRSGALDEAGYRQKIKDEIGSVIALQERHALAAVPASRLWVNPDCGTLSTHIGAPQGCPYWTPTRGFRLKTEARWRSASTVEA